MATEQLPAAHDREESDFTGQKRDTVVIVGAGQNTAHMGDSIARLSLEHPLHVFEVSQPLIDVNTDRLHMTNTEEGHRSAEALLGSRAVHAVYLSVIPLLHKPLLDKYLGHAGENEIDFVVLPKPFAQNVQELRDMRSMLRAAIARRQEIDPSYNPEASPMLFIHEHYKEKGAWHELRERLNQVTGRLGRLESVDIDIQEARTAEDEGRVAAFQGGALEDLGPHVISLGLDVQSSINTTDRYAIPNRSTTTVERFRYEDSELPEGIETSFIVHGQTAIVDQERGEAHSIDFTWRGGKGLVNKKDATLTFIHPDTGERSTIVVDLRANTLAIPDAVRDLFLITEFDDNGYGYSVESGLNGGDPHQSFQHIDEAAIVTKWQQALRNQGSKQAPIIHRRGSELRQLANAA
jgi:predicted dehydrogenase